MPILIPKESLKGRSVYFTLTEEEANTIAEQQEIDVTRNLTPGKHYPILLEVAFGNLYTITDDKGNLIDILLQRDGLICAWLGGLKGWLLAPEKKEGDSNA